GVEAIPALIYTLLVFRVPESPRWLIAIQDDFQQARAILTKTDPEGVDAAIALALKEKKAASVRIGFSALFRSKYLHVTMLAIVMALVNQLSGINAIMYVSRKVFEMAGINAVSALSSTIGIVVVNLFGTMLGLDSIDRIGRK